MEEAKKFKLYEGLSYSITKTITEFDLWTFAGLTEDFARIHTDYEFAKTTKNGRPICHGLIGANFASTVAGRLLGDNGALFLDEHVEFKAPLIMGDTITTTGVLTEIVEKHTAFVVTLECVCKNQKDEVINTVTIHQLCYKTNYFTGEEKL